MKTQKKLARLLCAFSLLQSYAHAAMSYGFHVGTNFASARVEGSSTDTGTATKIGVAAGVGVDVFLGGPLYLQMELSYMQRGFQVSSGQNVLGSTDRAVIDYLEFPILLRGQGLRYSPNRFSFLAGPVYAYRLQANISSTQPHVFHFLLGIGFECDVDKTTAFFVSGRYTFALSNALFGSPNTLKQDGIQVLLGLRFETLGDIFFKPKTERFERFKKLRTKGADY
ncbi:MAG: PorT family protein [Bdellovibrionaceae bacterium]|nr:PorT family protein [Pseudobdellovibrionaceae bacterium]